MQYRRTRTGIRSQCPAHPDDNPSLSVDVRSGRLLIFCFAGCSTRRVLAKLGLRYSDLYDEPRVAGPNGPQEVVATYNYEDAHGEVYARKRRYGPRKSFLWELRTERGWRTGLQGLHPHLYGQELLSDTKRVFVVEGEKDADMLRESGVIAIRCDRVARCLDGIPLAERRR
jgi:hypothetical protein